MKHKFEVEVATMTNDIEEAILIENIAFWIQKNIANRKHKHDGYYWTYNSAEAFTELFPYMNRRTISRKLKRLEEKGIIKTGNFNKLKYDKTKWYTIVDAKIKNIYSLDYDKLSNPLDKMTNGMTQNDQPIPDINTNDKPDRYSTSNWYSYQYMKTKIYDIAIQANKMEGFSKKKNENGNIEISVPDDCFEKLKTLKTKSEQEAYLESLSERYLSVDSKESSQPIEKVNEHCNS